LILYLFMLFLGIFSDTTHFSSLNFWYIKYMYLALNFYINKFYRDQISDNEINWRIRFRHLLRSWKQFTKYILSLFMEFKSYWEWWFFFFLKKIDSNFIKGSADKKNDNSPINWYILHLDISAKPHSFSTISVYVL